MSRKILLIHQQNHIGGGQTYVNELFQELRQQNYSVELIENQSYFIILKKIINLDVREVIWNVYGEFPIWIIVLAYFLGKKNVFIIFGIWFLEHKSGVPPFNGNVKLFLRQKLEQCELLIKQFIFCLFSSKIVHLSVYAKSLFFSFRLLRLLRYKKHVTIFGGANQDIFFSLSRKERLEKRRQLGIEKDQVVLFIAGRLERRKNYKSAIEILYKLQFQNKNILLYWAISYGKYNDWEYFNEVIDKARELGLSSKIRILSGITGKELANFFQVADVFLMLSSELETFGLVTVEALYCGCPVLGYATSATLEIVHSKYLVPLNDTQKIAKLLNKFFLLSESEKEKIRKKNSSITTKYNWKKSVKLINQ